MRFHFRRLLVSAVALFLGTVAARAQTLVNVAAGKSVTGSYYNSGSEVFPPSTITDGRFGDTGTGFDWSFWLSPQGTTNVPVTIDLAGMFSISSFVLQDSHNRGYYDRGTKDFTLRLSLDAINYTTVYTGAFSSSDWTDLNLVTINLSSAATGRYIQFEPLSLFGGQSAGLNELQAFGVAIPEPSTFALLGCGALAFFTFRRRRAE